MKRPNPQEFYAFLKHVGYNIGMSDAKALVHQYDSDRDGVLHTTEFHFLIISATERSLREKFMVKPSHAQVGDPSILGLGAETQLAKLMMTEIHGLRFLERDQGYLIAWRNLNSVVAYSLLK